MVDGVIQYPYLAVAEACEVFLRTLTENCRSSVIRVLTELRAKHANADDPNAIFCGIDGMFAWI